LGLPSAKEIEGVERLKMKVKRVAVRTEKKRLKLDFISTPNNGLTVVGYTKIVPNQIFFYYNVKLDIYEDRLW
jgi:hypothetical protein